MTDLERQQQERRTYLTLALCYSLVISVFIGSVIGGITISEYVTRSFDLRQTEAYGEQIRQTMDSARPFVPWARQESLERLQKERP